MNDRAQMSHVRYNTHARALNKNPVNHVPRERHPTPVLILTKHTYLSVIDILIKTHAHNIQVTQARAAARRINVFKWVPQQALCWAEN